MLGRLSPAIGLPTDLTTTVMTTDGAIAETSAVTTVTTAVTTHPCPWPLQDPFAALTCPA